MDLSDWTAKRKAAEGIGDIDILVNNATTLFGSSLFEIVEAERNSYDNYIVSYHFNKLRNTTLYYIDCCVQSLPVETY